MLNHPKLLILADINFPLLSIDTGEYFIVVQEESQVVEATWASITYVSIGNAEPVNGTMCSMQVISWG